MSGELRMLIPMTTPMRTSYVNTNDNWSDLLTKMLPFGEKRRRFVRSLVHHVYRDHDDYSSKKE